MSVAQIESKLYKGAVSDIRQVSLGILQSSLEILASFTKESSRSFDYSGFRDSYVQTILYLQEIERVRSDQANRAETSRIIKKKQDADFLE